MTWLSWPASGPARPAPSCPRSPASSPPCGARRRCGSRAHATGPATRGTRLRAGRSGSEHRGVSRLLARLAPVSWRRDGGRDADRSASSSRGGSPWCRERRLWAVSGVDRWSSRSRFGGSLGASRFESRRTVLFGLAPIGIVRRRLGDHRSSCTSAQRHSRLRRHASQACGRGRIWVKPPPDRALHCWQREPRRKRDRKSALARAKSSTVSRRCRLLARSITAAAPADA